MQPENNTFIYTLGPADTNCAAAAQWWFDNHNLNISPTDSKSRIIFTQLLKKPLVNLLRKKMVIS
ncbi:hypothetical protein [Bartonella refiksaydamii]|uniref:hypothetical protein n=1 Tax=Bartonella refiksaydamii TaxID=2654951 RepID=UPI0012ECA481|nr:hypothetical protein [Bartonella refiksaydamii]